MGKVARWLSLRGIISPWLSPVNFWCYLKYLRLNLLQASKCANFCIKISHEILQVWSCSASSAQPSLVTSPFKNWPQDFNSALQHFHQLFSCLYHLACIHRHPFQTSLFILGHTHPAYSFCQNYVIWSKSILLQRPNSMDFTALWTLTPWIFSCI